LDAADVCISGVWKDERFAKSLDGDVVIEITGWKGGGHSFIMFIFYLLFPLVFYLLSTSPPSALSPLVLSPSPVALPTIHH
jgi:hypothetical protein